MPLTPPPPVSAGGAKLNVTEVSPLKDWVLELPVLDSDVMVVVEFSLTSKMTDAVALPEPQFIAFWENTTTLVGADAGTVTEVVPVGLRVPPVKLEAEK